MSQSTLADLSNELKKTINAAAGTTVMVVGRHHHPISGVVYSRELILTAGHALEWNDEIHVLLPGGETMTAEVAGWDSISDLTLLKIEKVDMKPAETSAAAPQVGQLVIALARGSDAGIQAGLGIIGTVGGPLRLRHGGKIEQVIRADAARSPSFSGGPLVDIEGNVIGVNLFLHGSREPLTIPMNLARQIAENLAEHGSNFQGYLGIRSQPVTLPEQTKQELDRDQDRGLLQGSGLLIVGVESKSPAELSGLMVGDILVGLGGNPVPDHDELLNQLSGDIVGKEAVLEVVRGGQRQQFSITVGNRPQSRWHRLHRPCC